MLVLATKLILLTEDIEDWQNLLWIHNVFNLLTFLCAPGLHFNHWPQVAGLCGPSSVDGYVQCPPTGGSRSLHWAVSLTPVLLCLFPDNRLH